MNVRDVKWRKFKGYEGPLIRGNHRFIASRPYGVWTQVIGCIARCEGNFDTVVAYDNTGMTWGFLQWTFTSGRLQRLLEYFKTVSFMDFTSNSSHDNLFDELFMSSKEPGAQVFKQFGFHIIDGKFLGSQYEELNPAIKEDKQKIVDICMGRPFYQGNKSKERTHSKRLALELAKVGAEQEVAFVQTEFAKLEFKSCLDIIRRPLKEYKTIRNLIRMNHKDEQEIWDTPIPAIFFSLWQNSPALCYRFFIGAANVSKRRQVVSPEDKLDLVWTKLCKTKLANWGFNSKRYIESGKKKQPRVTRIGKAIKEFYNLDLSY